MHSYIRTHSYFVALLVFVAAVALFGLVSQANAACTAPTLGTAYTVSANCTFDGLVNGSDAGITINALTTLTANAGQTIVWAPGSSLVINGSIAISATGQLKQTYLWQQDADADGYPDQTRMYTGDTAPASGYTKRSLMTSYTTVDSYPSTSTCTTGSCTTTDATFSYTGAQQTYVVPSGKTSIDVEVVGGQGGTGASGGVCCSYPAGSTPGKVNTTLSVTPGETLYIYVGGNGQGFSGSSWSPGGTGGWNGGGAGGSLTSISYPGGGGGGASDIRQGGTALSNRVVVAGAGAGYGSSTPGTYNHLNGAPGSSGEVGTDGGTRCTNSGGKGGTASAGGAGGDGCQGNPGTAGASATGGTGGNGGSGVSGGGGGGGYYGGGGGGGGNADTGGSGGGGGSSYSAGTNTTFTASALGGPVKIIFPVAAATSSTCYIDSDGDGYGASYAYTCSGTLPSGMVTNATDCNDANASIYPGAGC